MFQIIFFVFSNKKKPIKRTKKPTQKSPSTWQFDSDSDDEAVVRQAPDQRLQSVLTRRVADGVVRRTANLDGDIFVDIKIYQVPDILNIDPKDRWEHAILSLKYQGQSDAIELAPLKDVIKRCRGQFKTEGKFFSSKK